VHAAFERFKASYPPFAGRHNWAVVEGHYAARLAHGATIAELQQAVERYAAYVAAGGASSTAHVLRPDTFLTAGDEPWTQPWELPTKIAKPTVLGWRPDPKDDPPLEAAGRA
jgi:hypothetical protein